MNFDQESQYPINNKRRDTGLVLRIWREEAEVSRWMKKHSGYKFADHTDLVHGWKDLEWFFDIVPVGYLYDDYHKWKLLHPRPIGAYEMAGLMNRRQFGMCLQVCLRDGTKNRYAISKRVCTRTGKKKNMRMLRGIRHPDGYRLREEAGRPSHDNETD